MKPSIKTLAELAEKATQGHWTWVNANHEQSRLGRLYGESDLILDADPGIFGNPADGRFISYCNPETILAIAKEWKLLLALIDKQAEENIAIAKQQDRLVEAIQAALRIQELWLPCVSDSPDEAEALHIMRNKFLEALALAGALEDEK